MEPKIRFKGFEGEWIETSLSNLSSNFKYGINAAAVSFDGENKYLRITDIDDTMHSFLQNDVTSPGTDLSCCDEYLMQDGDIVIARTGASVGKSYIYHPFDGKVYFAGFLIRMRLNENTNRDFVFQNTLTNAYAKHVQFVSQRSGQPGINVNELQAYKLRIPSLSEQQFIATYFRTLDNKIQSTSKKLASLKKLKSASLVAMFPQQGETTPKVRFKGFEGEWDKQSASDLFLTIDKRNRPELPVLSACQDVRGMIPRDKIGFNISHDTSNEVTYKRVQPGQFVIHLRSFQGGFAHSSYDGIISPAYTVFDFKNKEQHDDYYWKIVFMSRSFIERLRLITYGIRDGRSISFNEFKELSFLFPSKEEQQAIASFYRSLDRKIALETARLEKLKQIKLACLDKMFV